MKKVTGRVSVLLSLCVLGAAFGADNPYIGRWALTIPGGGAGWLGVAEEDGKLVSSLLWGGGSVVPTNRTFLDGDSLNVVRLQDVERKNAEGKTIRVPMFSDVIVAKASGDTLELVLMQPSPDGKRTNHSPFTGKRIPALSPKPDLSKVKFGKPVTLFDGTNMDAWKLIGNSQNGWSIDKDGVLVNKPVQPQGRHVSYGNLRTVAEFEDFNLKLEVKLAKNENSGVYLRGIYEIQVADTYGRPLDSHNMGGVYSRITPRMAAEKPVGEWQTMDLTLVDRHVTVILNGQKIIDNEPVLGCTGGALWSDEFKPGPIYLQGDHTGINYRNIVLTPVVK